MKVDQARKLLKGCFSRALPGARLLEATPTKRVYTIKSRNEGETNILAQDHGLWPGRVWHLKSLEGRGSLKNPLIDLMREKFASGHLPGTIASVILDLFFVSPFPSKNCQRQLTSERRWGWNDFINQNMDRKWMEKAMGSAWEITYGCRMEMQMR